MPELPTAKPRRSTGLKIIAVAACGVIVSLGLCKAGFYMSRNVHDGAPPDLAFLGGIGFLLSVVALAVGVLIAIIKPTSNSSDKQ